MKTLLAIFVFFLSSLVVAEEVYFCQSDIVSESSSNGVKEYGEENFKFIKKNNELQFGNGGFLNKIVMTVFSEGRDYFEAGTEYTRVIYLDGLFVLANVSNLENSHGVVSIIANCDKF